MIRDEPLSADLTESLMDISRTLGSISADVVNIKEDVASHREDAAARNDITVARLDNAAMRLAKLEAQIDDLAPEVGMLKKLRERGLGIVSAVGLVGLGLGTAGTVLATHWGAVVKIVSGFFKV